MEIETKEYHAKLEEYINMFIQPKPNWLPTFLWHWLLKRILVVQVLKGQPTIPKGNTVWMLMPKWENKEG